MAKQILSPVPFGDPMPQMSSIPMPQDSLLAKLQSLQTPDLVAAQNPAPSNPTDVSSTPIPGATQTPISMVVPKAVAPQQYREQKTNEKNTSSTTQNLYKTPEEQAASEEAVLNQKQYQNLNKGLDQYQQLLALQAQQTPGVDLSPLYNLGDALFSGPKMSPNYKAPQNPDLLKQLQTLQKDRSEAYKDFLLGQKGNLAGHQTTINVQGNQTDQSTGNKLSGYGSARIDALRMKAANDITGDKTIMQYNRTLDNLDKAKGLVNGTLPITSIDFNIIQDDLVNALTQSGNATVAKRETDFVHTFAGELNKIEQRGGTIDDLRKTQPEIFNHFKGLVDKIYADYQGQANKRLNEKLQATTHVNDPEIRNTALETAKSLRDRYMSDDDKKALEYLKTADPSSPEYKMVKDKLVKEGFLE